MPAIRQQNLWHHQIPLFPLRICRKCQLKWLIILTSGTSGTSPHEVIPSFIRLSTTSLYSHRLLEHWRLQRKGAKVTAFWFRFQIARQYCSATSTYFQRSKRSSAKVVFPLRDCLVFRILDSIRAPTTPVIIYLHIWTCLSTQACACK